jgi:hypothetical protein
VVFETQSIAAEQEAVYEAVKRDREHKLRLASLYAREAKDIIAGTYLEELVDDPAQLSDHAIEILAPPEVALEGVENRRKHYEGVLAVFDEAPETTVDRYDVLWLLEKAPYFAVEAVAFEEEERAGIAEGEGATEEEIHERASVLEDALWKRLGDKDAFTVGELREHLEWVAL